MNVQLFEMGRAQYQTIELPAWATVEQLALIRNVQGVFKRIVTWSAPAELQPTDVLNEGDKLIFAAATTTVRSDGTVQYSQKKISGANDDTVKVKIVKQAVYGDIVVPSWLTVKDALDMAWVRHGLVKINGELAWFWLVLDSDTVIELAFEEQAPVCNNSCPEHCDEEDYED